MLLYELISYGSQGSIEWRRQNVLLPPFANSDIWLERHLYKHTCVCPEQLILSVLLSELLPTTMPLSIDTSVIVPKHSTKQKCISHYWGQCTGTCTYTGEKECLNLKFINLLISLHVNIRIGLRKKVTLSELEVWDCIVRSTKWLRSVLKYWAPHNIRSWNV